VASHPADRVAEVVVAEVVVDLIRSGEEDVMPGHEGGWKR